MRKVDVALKASGVITLELDDEDVEELESEGSGIERVVSLYDLQKLGIPIDSDDFERFVNEAEFEVDDIVFRRGHNGGQG